MKHAYQRWEQWLPMLILQSLLLLVAATVTVSAQDQRISGRVLDANEPNRLPGVNIVITGTQTGVVTDANGAFTLNVPQNRDRLTVSAIGYEPQEIAIGNRSELSIQLRPDIKTLNEVIVTGYGAQQKRDITGAVATVDTKQLLSVPSTNVA